MSILEYQINLLSNYSFIILMSTRSTGKSQERTENHEGPHGLRMAELVSYSQADIIKIRSHHEKLKAQII